MLSTLISENRDMSGLWFEGWCRVLSVKAYASVSFGLQSPNTVSNEFDAEIKCNHEDVMT